MHVPKHSIDIHRQAELWLQDAAFSLIDDTPKQAAEAFHEVFKLYNEIGYTDEYFMQARERAVMLAEMQSDVLVTYNQDGSRNSVMREKLLKAEMELGKQRITSRQ